LPGEIFPDNAKNRQTLSIFKETMIKRLKSSGRIPLQEQKRLIALLPDPNRFWANPDTQAANLLEVRSSLQRRYNSNLRKLSGGVFDLKGGRQIVQENSDLKELIDYMSQPSESAPGSAAPSVPDDQQFTSPRQVPVGHTTTEYGIEYEWDGDKYVKKIRF